MLETGRLGSNKPAMTTANMQRWLSFVKRKNGVAGDLFVAPHIGSADSLEASLWQKLHSERLKIAAGVPYLLHSRVYKHRCSSGRICYGG